MLYDFILLLVVLHGLVLYDSGFIIGLHGLKIVPSRFIRSFQGFIRLGV